MQNFLQYLDIPVLTTDLVDEVYKSISVNKNVFPIANYPHYEIYKTTPKLDDAIKSLFNKNVCSNVHIVKNGIDVHIDIERNVAYNYIIESGGENVETCFYENDRSTLIKKYKIDTHKWHKLIVSVPHNVVNLTCSRIAITVSPI